MIDFLSLTHLIDLLFEYLLLAQLTAKRSGKITKSLLVDIYKLSFLTFGIFISLRLLSPWSSKVPKVERYLSLVFREKFKNTFGKN